MEFASTRLVILIGCIATGAVAQTGAVYPVKPVRVVIGYTAGGTADIVARIIGQKLGEGWDQPVIVDPRPGAAGNLAAEHVVKAVPDGYTLLLGQNSITVSPALYPNLSYDLQRDLVAVASAIVMPHVIVVHPNFPAHDVKGLIALSKARPKEILFASTGHGNADHMATELFNTMAGTQMVHVPYKGSPQVLTDVAGGEIPVYFAGLASVTQMLRSGRLRGIAVTSKVRAKAVPQLPTIAESGVPGYEALQWTGYFAPAATPRNVTERLAVDINRVLAMPDTIERLANAGVDPFPSTPEQFGRFIRAETEKWSGVVKRLGLQLDK